VVEPQMNTRVLNAPASVTVTGSVGGAVAAPPPTANAQRFEAARESAKRRAATSLADADAADLSGRADARRVGSRTFVVVSGKWIDQRKADSLRLVKVKAFSEAYFKLMETIPELKEVFALGDKVVVAGRDVRIEIGEGGVETLNDAELKRIQSAW
jgi:hypothetical protein